MKMGQSEVRKACLEDEESGVEAPDGDPDLIILDHGCTGPLTRNKAHCGLAKDSITCFFH